MSQKFRAFTILLMIGVFLAGFAGAAGYSAAQLDKVTIVIHPDRAVETLEESYGALTAWLEPKLGVEIEFFIPISYNAQVEAMVAGQGEIAQFGGFTFVQAAQRVDIFPIVTTIPQGLPGHRSAFIKQAGDDSINSLEDLAGKNFAFGSAGSTSGHLMPRFFLKEAGIIPEDDFAEFTFTGRHDATLLAVANKSVDAGVLYEPVLRGALADGTVTEDDIEIIWISPTFADYSWAVQRALPAELVHDLTSALILLDGKINGFESVDPVIDPSVIDQQEVELLRLLQIDGFKLTNDADFDGLRDIGTSLGLLDPQ